MSRTLRTLLLGTLLLSAGCPTRYVNVPVKPVPCSIPPFPVPPAGIELRPCGSGVGLDVCTTPIAAAERAAWESAVADWRDAVLACPTVKTVVDVPVDNPAKTDVVPVQTSAADRLSVADVVTKWNWMVRPDVQQEADAWAALLLQLVLN